MSVFRQVIEERAITFVPVIGVDHIKQSIKFGGNSKGASDTWLTMRVVSEDPDSTQLVDGRSLSDLTGELTLKALPDGQVGLKDNTDGEPICGVLLAFGRQNFGRPDYSVTVYLSIQELHQIAELTRTRRLATIQIDFRAPVASGDVDDDKVPGVHAATFGQQAYFVWDSDQAIPIDSTKLEFELDREPNGGALQEIEALARGRHVRQIVARAHKTLAGVVVNFPQAKWEGDGARATSWGDSQEPTAEQIQRVSRTYAAQQVETLIKETCKQGHHVAYQAACCAVEFVKTNGIIYRARAQQVAKAKKGSLKNTLIVIPDILPMWAPPTMRANQVMDGWNSLEMVDREALVNISNQYFRSGARCQWFEKMLVEALVGAEAYATLKLGKTEPSHWTGEMQLFRTLVATWAFGKTRGGPMYQVYRGLGDLAVSGGKLAVFIGFSWWAYSAYEEKTSWRNVLGLVAMGLVGIGWLGRYITRQIVRWANQIPSQATSVLATPFGSALSALLTSYGTVTGQVTSITAARDSLRSAMSKGGAIDPIALAFLDRAHESNEYAWLRPEISHWPELDDVESEVVQPGT
jgi:hypothetical protein